MYNPLLNKTSLKGDEEREQLFNFTSKLTDQIGYEKTESKENDQKSPLTGERIMEFTWWCKYWLNKDPKRVETRYTTDPEFQLYVEINARL
jgi:hypothetical protein